MALVCVAAACASCQKEEPAGGTEPDEPQPVVEDVTTIKDFAQQLVTYLDVWEKTTGTVSADGSHASANNTAWKNVHFIPIPHSGGVYPDGKDQYASQYKPYPTITVNGTEYTAAQAYVLAAKCYLDLVTKEGSAVEQSEINLPAHTPANGKKLSDAIPEVEEWVSWGKYPWYEKSDDPSAINLSNDAPCDLTFLTRTVAWGLHKLYADKVICNCITFGKEPTYRIVLNPYSGNISSMREFLILCRFYKYLLDNKITENVYDAVKNVNFDYDLYGVDITLGSDSVTLPSDKCEKDFIFSSKAAWTAEVSGDASWLTVSPASGSASSTAKITISAHSNTSTQPRTAKILIKGGNVTDGLELTVNQTEYTVPLDVTARDFAIEFTKCLDIWEKTVGTVDADGKHNGKNAWENVHFIPIGEPVLNPYGKSGNQYDSKYQVWSLQFGENVYTSAQAWEIAARLFLNLVTEEGENGLLAMKTRNTLFTYADGGKLSDKIPAPTAGCRWGPYPWYEYDKLVTYNGQAIESVGVKFLVRALQVHLGRAFIDLGWHNGALGYIGNYQEFGTNKSSQIVEEGYEGYISSMRELVVLARVYKYLLDNDINENIYTALQDKTFDFDMYHQLH